MFIIFCSDNNEKENSTGLPDVEIPDVEIPDFEIPDLDVPLYDVNNFSLENYDIDYDFNKLDIDSVNLSSYFPDNFTNKYGAKLIKMFLLLWAANFNISSIEELFNMLNIDQAMDFIGKIGGNLDIVAVFSSWNLLNLDILKNISFENLSNISKLYNYIPLDAFDFIDFLSFSNLLSLLGKLDLSNLKFSQKSLELLLSFPKSISQNSLRFFSQLENVDELIIKNLSKFDLTNLNNFLLLNGLNFKLFDNNWDILDSISKYASGFNSLPSFNQSVSKIKNHFGNLDILNKLNNLSIPFFEKLYLFPDSVLNNVSNFLPTELKILSDLNYNFDIFHGLSDELTLDHLQSLLLLKSTNINWDNLNKIKSIEWINKLNPESIKLLNYINVTDSKYLSNLTGEQWTGLVKFFQNDININLIDGAYLGSVGLFLSSSIDSKEWYENFLDFKNTYGIDILFDENLSFKNSFDFIDKYDLYPDFIDEMDLSALDINYLGMMNPELLIFPDDNFRILAELSKYDLSDEWISKFRSLSIPDNAIIDENFIKLITLNPNIDLEFIFENNLTETALNTFQYHKIPNEIDLNTFKNFLLGMKTFQANNKEVPKELNAAMIKFISQFAYSDTFEYIDYSKKQLDYAEELFYLINQKPIILGNIDKDIWNFLKNVNLKKF